MRTRALAVIAALGLLGCADEIQFSDGEGVWDKPPRASFADRGRFAITDNLSDQISFVDGDVGKPSYLGKFSVGNVPVALEGPHHLAASPDGRYIYYNLSNYVPGTSSGPHGAHGAGTVPGSLVKIDAATGAKVGEVIVDRNPGDVILTKDGGVAYVSHYDQARAADALLTGKPEASGYSAIAVVDTATMVRLALLPVCAAAHGLGLSRDERTLFVTCSYSDELGVIDVSNPSAPKVKARVKVGPAPGPLGQPAYSPYALAISPRDGSVWVSDLNSFDVRVYDPVGEKMDPDRVFPVGGAAMFGQFSSSGQTYYVPHQGDDRLTAIDTGSFAMRDLVFPTEACLNAHAFLFTPDEQGAVVVCEGNHSGVVPGAGTIVFLSIPSFSVNGYVTSGAFPDAAAWLPPAP